MNADSLDLRTKDGARHFVNDLLVIAGNYYAAHGYHPLVGHILATRCLPPRLSKLLSLDTFEIPEDKVALITLLASDVGIADDLHFARLVGRIARLAKAVGAVTIFEAETSVVAVLRHVEGSSVWFAPIRKGHDGKSLGPFLEKNVAPAKRQPIDLDDKLRQRNLS